MIGEAISLDLVFDPLVMDVFEIAWIAQLGESQRCHHTFCLLARIIVEIFRRLNPNEQKRSAAGVFENNIIARAEYLPTLRYCDLKAIAYGVNWCSGLSDLKGSKNQ